jgi:pimeloyl-ACP methyl ester carboxylesterase
MGLGGNADWWDERFLRPLAERYRVVAFDNRGAGRSGTPEGPYTISLMASDAAGLMDHLGWESAHVLGFSMGGMIAQELTCTCPERVRRLVLLCTNCGGKERVNASADVSAVLTMPRDGLTPEDIARASLYLLFPQEYIEKEAELMGRVTQSLLIAPTNPRCFMEQLKAADAWSIHARLGRIKQPTLIITGERDIMIPPQNSRILAEAIPDSRLVEFAGAGHLVTSMFPEETAREVLGFLG